jgi:hypothetical protein
MYKELQRNFKIQQEQNSIRNWAKDLNKADISYKKLEYYPS